MSNKVVDSIIQTLKNEGPFYLSEPSSMLVDYYKNIGTIFKIIVVYYKRKPYNIVDLLEDRPNPLGDGSVLDTLVKSANKWYASKNFRDFEKMYYG